MSDGGHVAQILLRVRNFERHLKDHDPDIAAKAND